MRCRDDEDLALDRIDAERTRGPAHLEPAHASPAPPVARPSVDELQAELAQLRERIGHYPEHLADQLHAARSAQAEAQRVADEARARVAELERPARRRAAPSRRATPPNAAPSSANASSSPSTKSRRRPSASATSRPSVPDRATWEAERRALRERAAELEAQLSIRRREHLHDALERPAPYLSAALGEPPDQPRARRTWQQAATAHRGLPLRPRHHRHPPRPRITTRRDTRERAHWQRAQHDLQRAQRDLGHHNARQHSHEI